MLSPQRFWRSPFTPIDIAALVYFRIAFGAIMFWEVWRYFQHDWISRYWIVPPFHFTYYGFGWVQPWPGYGMYLHFVGLGVLALLILAGCFYRLSTILFFLGFTYVFLLEQARYLNHFYLICLLSLLLIFMPAHRSFSLDILRRPHLATPVVPAWTLWLLQFQIAIPYVYGGLAKLNSDWLQGEPMGMWLAARTDFPLIGPWFTEAWIVHLLSYGGLLLDLLVVPGLLWRRTRPFAFMAAAIFHLMNARLFSIGIFPWFMIAATALFFPPDWPRRLLLPSSRPVLQDSQLLVGRAKPLRSRQSLILILLGGYIALQLLVPFRHYLYPGNVSWTEEGHRFAWHMKLRSKRATAKFLVTENPGEDPVLVNPNTVLTDWQTRKMAARPDMILQFSHYLAEQWHQVNDTEAIVRANVSASLNGRPPQLLIDPAVDLAAQPRTLGPAAWIMPLRVSLVEWEQ